MKLVLHKKTSAKTRSRIKKKVRIRKKLAGTLERPRLCVFKSNKYIYAQIINDDTGATLVEFNSIKVSTKGNGIDLAKTVGLEVAKKALSKNISSVVFDRNGYLYHGRVKSLAEGAREAGLKF